jgi:ribosomal protein S18 acetylase RimI-like enzyme
LLKTHEQVVLYVGAENPAQKLYDRVGFQDLREETPRAERWLEIGFDGAEVGHW